MRQTRSMGPFLSPADIRRKLEGQLEVVEAAYGAYVRMERLLGKRQWERRLYANLPLLWQVVGQDAALEKALACIHQRARLERWPEKVPALKLAHRMGKLRKQLAQRVQDCLGAPGVSGERLPQTLVRLERYVVEMIPPPLSPEEKVLLRGACSTRGGLPALLALGLPCSPFPLSMILGKDLSVWQFLGFAVWLWLLFTLSWSLWQHLCSGHLRVTQERLIWEPVRGRPIQVPLRSLVPGGARGDWETIIVEVAGGPDLRLSFMGDMEKLIARLNFMSTWQGDADSLTEAIEELNERYAHEAREAIGPV